MSIHLCLCGCVYAFVHVSACIFFSTCRVRGSCFRLVSPRSRSRILARGLQVRAYGAGLGKNEISDPFTPILRPLQYHIFSVGSRCHGVVTSYPHSTFIVFISSLFYKKIILEIALNYLEHTNTHEDWHRHRYIILNKA